MDRTVNVFISGVGGQGILLASEILSDVALAHGMDVKKSEVHGMAQRGGSVVSHVRFGKKVYSPVIAEGEADLLVSFEKMEALRWVHYLSPDGTVIVNDQEIVPSGLERYPEGIDKMLSDRSPDALLIDAFKLANEAGHPRAVNTVMLGAFSNYLDFPDQDWRDAIAKRVPSKTVDINLRAFDLGRAAGARR
ncbi:MAG: indolepyruvate oxidoreductase subunit beta [Candidatus Eisenbacteria bacterium]|nr:indolepyruvate oxidoreductase subunit beta [Candidatus Eisenbacteria bacterium]